MQYSVKAATSSNAEPRNVSSLSTSDRLGWIASREAIGQPRNFIPWLLEVAISKACILQRTSVPLLTENDNHNYKTVHLLLGVASPASSPHVAKEQDFKADGVGRSGAVQAHLAGTIVLCSGRI